MPDQQTPYAPLPPDDLTRSLAAADPDREGKLPHIGLVGDTYTITVDGEDTKGRFCVVDMHVPPGAVPDRIAITLRKPSSCSMGKLRRPFVANEGSFMLARRSISRRTLHIGFTTHLQIQPA